MKIQWNSQEWFLQWKMQRGNWKFSINVFITNIDWTFTIEKSVASVWIDFYKGDEQTNAHSKKCSATECDNDFSCSKSLQCQIGAVNNLASKCLHCKWDIFLEVSGKITRY